MKYLLTIFFFLTYTSIIFAQDISVGQYFPTYSKTLSNGLKVIVVEKHDIAVAEIQLWYKVGSKDEKPGIRGMAHMFEHMMFRGSKNFPGEGDVFIDSISAFGGQMNAYTTFDRTVYHETVPVEKINSVFKMEADRMENLILDQRTLEIERQVVGEELRNGQNNWFQRVNSQVYEKLYPNDHPYRVDVIGYLDTILMFTTSQCQEFYDNFYSPNNCVLIIVGDVKKDEIFSAAEKYFGNIKKQLKYELKNNVPDIMKDSLRQYEFSVDFPIQLYGYMIPKPSTLDPDFYSYLLLKNLLFTNTNSILQQKLVNEQHSAYSINNLSDDYSYYTNYSMIYIAMNAAPGNVKVKKTIAAEIQSIIDEGLEQSIIDNYIKHIESDKLLSSYSNDFLANRLGIAEMYYNDYTRADEMINAFKKIKSEDLSAVAEKYFNPQNLKVVNIKPIFN